MTTLLKNCRLISPDADLDSAAILIDGERIKRIYAAGDAAGTPYQMAEAAGEGNRAALAMAKEMDAMD